MIIIIIDVVFSIVLEDISTKEEKSPEKNVPRESSEKNISGLG